MAEIRREGIIGRETASRSESWNKHCPVAELNGTPVGERGRYLSIDTDGARRLVDLTLSSAKGIVL